MREGDAGGAPRRGALATSCSHQADGRGLDDALGDNDREAEPRGTHTQPRSSTRPRSPGLAKATIAALSPPRYSPYGDQADQPS